MGSVGANKGTAAGGNFSADGKLNKDGSMRFQYLHIQNPNTQNFGTLYGQNLEPSGEYMTFIPQGTPHVDLPNYQYGVIEFEKPLVLEHKSTGENGWKKDLSEMYGGKTGKALSNAVMKDGYDAIVTWDEFKGQWSWSEIVNLKGKKQ